MRIQGKTQLFIARLKIEDRAGEASIYPICEWKDMNGNVGWSYISSESSDHVDDIDEARCLFEVNIRWRGVWDERVYFKDEEYWGEEIQDIYTVYIQVSKKIKDEIKKLHPKIQEWE